MPSYHCQFPTCTALLETQGSYCAKHQPIQDRETADRHRVYDQHLRDPEAKKFYNSAGWKHCRDGKLAANPVCQRCQRVFAQHVHHIKPLAKCNDLEKLDPANLMSVCAGCHNALEAEASAIPDVKPAVSGMLELTEDETYYFDAEAAEKSIRFIEKYIVHTEGRDLKGKPFLLEPIQKQILRDVHGYRHRVTGLRRFSRFFWNGAVGCGKSPLLAAVGVAELISLAEPGEQLYSMAADYSQARTIFDQAKKFIKANPQLLARCDVLQYEIRCNTNGAVWRIVSGSGPKAGARPGAIYADECHQWKSDECYNDLTDRLAKMAQPICWIATNRAEESGSVYSMLLGEAEAVLDGTRDDPTLYPILWCADDDAEIDDPNAWRQANPLMGVTMKEEKVRAELEQRRGNPTKEATFRRLYLGQRVTASGKWLDLKLVERAMANPVDTEALKGTPLYIGLDMSLCDDLCADTFLWTPKRDASEGVTQPDRYSVTTHFWVPAVKADYYQRQEGIPYDKWIDDGHIAAVPESTINPDVELRIAAEIIERAQGHTVKAVLYDPYRAKRVVAALEAAGFTCIPVRQGHSVSPGCFELERRLKEGSIWIQPNGVMASCAANVEVHTDRLGNIWPKKPNARGKYAGKRGKKIDGIAALVTAMTEAIRCEIKPEETQSTGEIYALEMDE